MGHSCRHLMFCGMEKAKQCQVGVLVCPCHSLQHLDPTSWAMGKDSLSRESIPSLQQNLRTCLALNQPQYLFFLHLFPDKLVLAPEVEMGVFSSLPGGCATPALIPAPGNGLWKGSHTSPSMQM